MAELEELERAGLLRIESNWISVTPKGRMLIRSICMVFDKNTDRTATAVDIRARSEAMRITFLGAAREVTGSCYWIRNGERSCLVDCGMFQGGSDACRKNSRAIAFRRRTDRVRTAYARAHRSLGTPAPAAGGWVSRTGVRNRGDMRSPERHVAGCRLRAGRRRRAAVYGRTSAGIAVPPPPRRIRSG